MAFVPVAQRMTAQKFLDLPVPELGRPWNLVDGEVVVTEPVRLHERTQVAFLRALLNWAEAEPGRGSPGLAIDIAIDDRNVYAPDVTWYREGRAPGRHHRAPYPVPDLAVEVRSPSTWRYDIGAKKAGYERRGLPELWLVDTAAEAVLVFRRSSAKAPGFDVALELTREDRLTSPLLPGFALALAELFPTPS